MISPLISLVIADLTRVTVILTANPLGIADLTRVTVVLTANPLVIADTSTSC